MSKAKIPDEWDLAASRRYKHENMERAMRGKIERGLVELITNSDDSYRNIEEKCEKISGKIRIEIERRKGKYSSTVIVRDRAEGMNREQMFKNLGELGKRTSGFEKGKLRRGLHGRGARDVVAFGTVHFESIKDREYNHLIIPPSLKCSFKNPRPKKANQEIRKRLGIPRGNGTVVTIDVENRFKIPLHERLVRDFSRYYSLRDIFSDSSREVIIVDLKRGRKDLLKYIFPEGDVVFDNDLEIPDYPDAKAHLIMRRHATPFDQCDLPYREGILIKSGAAIHDCTYFGLDIEPFSWRFSGELRCEFIDKLAREFDDLEDQNPDRPNHPENNPQRLLDPFRDGLIREHPFVQALYKKCREILKPLIEEIKEEKPKREVTDENLDEKLNQLSKAISRLFEKKLIDLEEEIHTEDIDESKIKQLGLGLHIIPPEEQPIIVNNPKTFSIIVKHHEVLDISLPINVISSNPDNVKVRLSPIFIKKLSEDGKLGRSTFTVESNKVGSEAIIEALYGGYNNLILVKTVELPLPEFPNGLSFEKFQYRLGINKVKTLILRLNSSTKPFPPVIADISSDNSEVFVKGGGRCELHPTEWPKILIGKCRVQGRQIKAKANITAHVKGFEPANCKVTIEEKEPTSGIKFKPPKPVEDNFGIVRYKWHDKEPYLLLIGAKHPSIRRYLGEPTDQGYPGVKDPLYHTVLAEVIAEALAFTILEKQIKQEGGVIDYTSIDTYYHRNFSEFLSITHKHLVTLISNGTRNPVSTR